MAEQEPLNLELKTGTLSESFGIKPEDDIPNALLRAIIEVKIPEGQESLEITNPTYIGNGRIKVTALLKKKSGWAYTAKNRWGVGN
jgi:hypothetical protein